MATVATNHQTNAKLIAGLRKLISIIEELPEEYEAHSPAAYNDVVTIGIRGMDKMFAGQQVERHDGDIVFVIRDGVRWHGRTQHEGEDGLITLPEWSGE